MYSLWKSGFDFKLEKTAPSRKLVEWTVNDVYHWVISLRMSRSVLIANAFKKEEIDGEVLLLINKEDISDIFKDCNLGRIGLFWLAIYKLRKH
jgi:hypothetical protein